MFGTHIAAADVRRLCTACSNNGLHSLLLLAMQRAIGEFGAVSVISGNIIGRTQTLTLYVEGAYKVLFGSLGNEWHSKHPADVEL
jgi:ABC-type molybdate transport system permease subunit